MMQMIRLANALEQAAAQDNWLKVRELDSQIALLLSELREASLSDGDLQRLALLRKQHASVLTPLPTACGSAAHPSGKSSAPARWQAGLQPVCQRAGVNHAAD